MQNNYQISLISTILLNEPYLLIKEEIEDGSYYYMPLMKVTIEELDFKGGRFEKYLHSSKLKKNKCYVEFNNCSTSAEKIIDWVSLNATGYWNLDVDINFDIWIVSFENERDAIMFKLFW